MIENLPFIKLPGEFTSLLKRNFQTKKEQEEFVIKKLAENPAIVVVLEKSIREMKKEMNMSKAVRAYGWEYIRDKLAELYLNRTLTHRYMTNNPNFSLQDLVEFEDKFFDFSTKGISRTFLLGFYLKLSESRLMDEGTLQNANLLESVKNISRFIKLRSVKSLRTDWLILTVWHFVQFFGEENFEEVLSKCHNEYRVLYNELDEDQKETMIGNLISYGASIKDHYTLLNGFILN
ncbi:MAG: hypothetical protein H6620_03840 [Halobacteriovoraceae bacterium]|nr:hypothetical protein [Halobacteriovoraceae bacterium]